MQQDFLGKIETSFKNATKGKETTRNLIWKWGLTGYLIAYFIINKLIEMSDLHIVKVGISLLAVIYFIWHIFALKKCSPKKIKLTKAEKKLIKFKNKQGRGKRMLRKFLLQESISKWDPILVTIAIDVLCLVHFFGYVV